MAVTTYYSVGGEIMAERSGSTRTDYTRDALGSVIGTKRVSGIINQPGLTNTYRYKPYGERLSKTGNAPDPRFQWRVLQATVANSLLSTPVKNYDLSSCQVFGLVRDSIVQKGTLMGGALSRKYPVCGGIGAQWQNLKPSEVWISHHGISITQCGGGEFHTWWKLPPTGARSAVGAVIQKVNIVTSPCFTN